MQLKRVVVTGYGAVSPFGQGAECLLEAIIAGRGCVSSLPWLLDIRGLRTAVAAVVPELDQKAIPRKYRRNMSPMSIYAAFASMEALRAAGVTEEMASSGRLGLCIGSTVGSLDAMEEFFRSYLRDNSVEEIRSTLFFRIMNHSCAANVAQMLGVRGRVLAPGAACATGCEAVGLGYEAVMLGRQEMVLCGGADEFHPLAAATFDIINAASTRYNDTPDRTPRPFDSNRDGVVCAEGSGMLLLESLDSARERGVPILAEVMGFASTSDPSNPATPSADAIETCMRQALDDADLAPDIVDYVNAHATGTELGDVAECEAIARVFGDCTSVSGFKGHLGHTMAASGSLELIVTLGAAARDLLIPTRNLEQVDPRCAQIKHVLSLTKKEVNIFLKNNFALGGINSSLVMRRYIGD